ncbi:toll/interleukin-1 receptor domain-containing protein [Clostridium butyricum]|nr:toll/interleukin-1 receptor domain-containing protein [Clostridium butyricum]
MKKIYISYSWDNNTNMNRVKGLVEDLEEIYKNKYTIVFDQESFKNRIQDVDRFMLDNILDAYIVIVFITPSYVEKANKPDNGYGNGGTVRSGVEKETSYLVTRRNQQAKSIIPVLLEGSDRPKYIEGLSFIDKNKNSDIIRELKDMIDLFEIEKEKDETINLIDENNVINKVSIDKIDINFNFEGEPVRVSGIICINNNYFTLRHDQIIYLFKKIISEDSCNEQKVQRTFSNKYFFLEFTSNQLYEKFLDIIKDALKRYIEQLLDFEAKYEICSREPMNNQYEFKLATMERKVWIKMIKFANSLDWSNGKSSWNIFQENDCFIHVFSPIVSNNLKYNFGQHAILYAIKNKNLYYDDVDVYVKINDIASKYDKREISVRNTWSINMVFEWLKNEFVPFFCKRNQYEENIVQFEECNQYKKDIFSQAQDFYMSNKVVVEKEELKLLRDVLVFCLSKKTVGEDSYYIKSKLRISDDLNTTEEIRKYIESNKYTKYLMECSNNSSMADDILRCIKSFTDNFSTHKINDYDITYCERKIKSLIDKMEKIKLLEKYEF